MTTSKSGKSGNTRAARSRARKNCLATHTCPISLEPVRGRGIGSFQHDGVVFSRQALVAYIKSSCNFKNAVTRREMTRTDVVRLKDKEVLRMYAEKTNRQAEMQRDINLFFFLENNVQDMLQRELENFNFFGNDSTPCPFVDACTVMTKLDAKRASCVHKSLQTFITKHLAEFDRFFARRLLKRAFPAFSSTAKET